MRRAPVLILLTFLLLPPCDGLAEIVIRDALVVGPISRSRRSLLTNDPIESARVNGTFPAPHAGDLVTLPDGTNLPWTNISIDKDGWLTSDSLAGGYAFATVENDDDRVMILDAAGHSTVFVNGEPRAGDPYEYGFVRLPVLLKKGTNELLFVVGAGVCAKLVEPRRVDGTYVDLSDSTTPDFVENRRDTLPFAVLYVNPTTQPVTKPDVIPPLSARKVAREMAYDGVASSLKDESTGVEFRIREPGQTRKITFVSEIDGSVQYYALNPASPDTHGDMALVLSLHGAGVEATSQADAYSPKPWCDIVCPTNRRPFGFDWEDWGRLDALEVLDHATTLLKSDPSLIYLTGHSMGGHGVWHLAALLPDRFAAIGPSAGWISFATYAAAATQPSTRPVSSIAQLIARANIAGDTAALVRNYASQGIYILHGVDDDNVPVAQARQMAALITPFHRDFTLFEQPKAGHWWDVSDEPGADCVDWPAMFDCFARHRLPNMREVREVNFITPNPSASSSCHWVTIEAQLQPFVESSASIRVDPIRRRFSGTTQNVARLSIDLQVLSPGEGFEIELDKQTIRLAPDKANSHVWLAREQGLWQPVAPSPALKGPHRSGPFKEAFRRRMIFVYGTQGTPEENAWALAKARFDAETFWVRGNGSVPVVPDTAFDPAENPDRNVIVYGNADTVKCWRKLVDPNPVDVRQGRITIGSRTLEGNDLACLAIRPRRGSDRALVAVIGGTGMTGMRATDRLPIFASGIGLPDCLVFDAGAKLRAAGFYGNDWSVESGEFTFEDLKKDEPRR